MIIMYITLFAGVLFGLFEVVNLTTKERFWFPDKWIFTKRYTPVWIVATGFAIIFTIFMAWGIASFLIEKEIPAF